MTVLSKPLDWVRPNGSPGLPHGSGAACPLLVDLLRALNADNVPYCYWKSASKLGQVMAASSDLDLLVPRRARASLFRVMELRGFKARVEPQSLRQPEFVSFLGYDESVGVIVHVHAHFRLILGAALAKDYHIPLEEELVARGIMDETYPIIRLDPTDEVLIGRMRELLEGGLLDLPTRLRAKARMEPLGADIELLRNRAERVLSPATALQFAVRHADNFPAQWLLRRRLKSELQAWRLVGSFVTAVRLVHRTLMVATARVASRYCNAALIGKHSAPCGGVVIAFVGVDGSGKSTQVRSTGEWLSRELDVTAIYFGTGDGAASLPFRPFKILAEVVGRNIKVKPRGASHGRVSDKAPGALYSILFTIWAFAVAFDKHLKFARMRRAVARGAVVITDRYPQNEDLDYNDGPLLHRLSAVPNWVRKLERGIYLRAERTPPDLLVKLQVGPVAVAAREPDMRTDLIAKRIGSLERLSCGGAPCIKIDGSASLVEVTRRVRQAVWRVL